MTEGDEEEARIVGISFSAWKHDLINALNSDVNLGASDARVAIALVKHVSSDDYTAFPSQETIAEITNMGPRNVRKCLDRLRALGWLRWLRGHEKKSNEYEFDRMKIAEEIGRMKKDDQARKRRRKERSERNSSSSQKRNLTGTTVPLRTGTVVPPNPLIEHGTATDGPAREDAA